MKKVIYLIIAFCLISLSFGYGCNDKPVDPVKEKYVVEFIDEKGYTMKSIEVEEGSDVTLPEFTAEKEGFYYQPKFDLEELKNINDNKFLEMELLEYKKIVNYIINGVVERTLNCNYTKETYAPNFDSSKMESYDWVLDKKFDGSIYTFNYTLSYKAKETYTITFFDGDKVLDLEPSTYKSSQGVKLPTYSKAGYEFVGWFPSDISLCDYSEIKPGSVGNYRLYARFIETEVHETFVLPEASNHFTGTTKSDTWNPILPIDAPEQSVSKYTWTSSNTNVLTISSWSSFGIVSTGYSVITATLNSDPTYTINGVFRSSVDDITLVDADDVNNIQLVNITFKGKNGETLSKCKILKGTFAVLPTPPTYDGYGFTGWDHENVNLREDMTITATYQLNFKNNYVGKSFSFIGDSLTSYSGFIPSGYATFFPYPTANVNDINQMWFMKALNKIGGKMFINDSEGGTTIQGGSHPASEDDRLKHLKCGEQYADVTIVYMGNNDCAAYSKGTSGYTLESFEKYYRQMLGKIMKLCPDTEIVLCTFGLSKLYTSKAQKECNVIIRKLADVYNLKVVEFESVDLTKPEGTVKLIVDNGHPSRRGMEIIADKFYSELLK